MSIANLSFLLLIVYLFIASLSVDASEREKFTWAPTTAVKPLCRGSVADCMSYDDEFGMESDINRRILATTNYISYGALQSNTVPCSKRGASYYNCQEGAEANPYDRGCSAITQCRS